MDDDRPPPPVKQRPVNDRRVTIADIASRIRFFRGRKPTGRFTARSFSFMLEAVSATKVHRIHST
jgi:hypothetical protein